MAKTERSRNSHSTDGNIQESQLTVDSKTIMLERRLFQGS